MQRHSWFTTVHNEGSLLPLDLLQRIAAPESGTTGTGSTRLDGLTPASYHLEGERLNEAINQSWNRMRGSWSRFQVARAKLPGSDLGTTLTRERWLLPLFSELGYGRLTPTPAIELDDRSYPISHRWSHTPLHLVSYRSGLDERPRGKSGMPRTSPYSLVQEVLNRDQQSLWGMVSNGLRLRLLRNNASLTRQSYIEFDLEAMMEGEVYADFVLFWLLCQESRFEGERPAECWLERWMHEAQQQGMRALELLRTGVERAIQALGSGFLASTASPGNQALRDKLRSGELSTQDYYRQLLRLVYRLIVLFVAEDRDILFHPQSGKIERERYHDYYSTQRLRQLAARRSGTRHADLYCTLRLITEKLGNTHGCPELGLPALNGFLFSLEATADLNDCILANADLLDAVRALAFTMDKQRRRAVDYKNLGSEELGSVYESLLELHPVIHLDAATFKLTSVSGNERKTSGSYYTPTSLITSLLDTALDPVLEEAYAQPDAERAILNLKVCDPACGSGHFLIAAAHRIAKRLAMVRTGEEEPGADERRHALRDVISSCIYGVDMNPMAVELCKVSLWLEAIEPGKPLSFLDHHIQCGNSLLGTTPALLSEGIPDRAFEPTEGDNKELCRVYKKQNKLELDREHQTHAGQLGLWDAYSQAKKDQHRLEAGMRDIDAMSDADVASIHRKQAGLDAMQHSQQYRAQKMRADAWCAAFVQVKRDKEQLPVTHDLYQKINEAANPDILFGSSYDLQEMRDDITRLAAQYQFFHWHLAFPDVFRLTKNVEQPENEQAGWNGGFDVVLGNPPWERIKIQEKEWFAEKRPDIMNAANAAQRRRMISALSVEDPALFQAFVEAQYQSQGESHFIRNSERYPLCGRGDVNTYTIFAETMRILINPTGRVGCIVPSGIATDDTTKVFFQEIMNTQTLDSLYSFENEEFVFPGIHHATKFCLLTISGYARPQVASDFVFFARQTSYLAEQERHFSLSREDVALFNPNTRTCPIFRFKRDMGLTRAIYKSIPILIKDAPVESNNWNITFTRMFDMANDSHLFRTYEQLHADGWRLDGNMFYKGNEVCLPLYEGKMIWLFDHRFGTYDGQTQAQANQGKLPELSEQQHADPLLATMPHYWIHQSHFPQLMKDKRKALLVFRDITGAVVFRTAIFSIIPVVPCGHTMPVVSFDDEHTKKIFWLESLAASFIFDYCTRQKLGGTHMTFSVLKQLPVLSPDTYKLPCRWNKNALLGKWILPRVLELTYTAWDLREFARECGYNGPPFRWDEERRFLLRCELDAAYFHLYSIARDDVDYIMETFPIVKRKDEKAFGEYRTKRVILEMYDAMALAMETGTAYESPVSPPPASMQMTHTTELGASRI